MSRWGRTAGRRTGPAADDPECGHVAPHIAVSSWPWSSPTSVPDGPAPATALCAGACHVGSPGEKRGLTCCEEAAAGGRGQPSGLGQTQEAVAGLLHDGEVGNVAQAENRPPVSEVAQLSRNPHIRCSTSIRLAGASSAPGSPRFLIFMRFSTGTVWTCSPDFPSPPARPPHLLAQNGQGESHQMLWRPQPGPQQDDAGCSGQSTPECQFAKVLVERDQHTALREG